MSRAVQATGRSERSWRATPLGWGFAVAAPIIAVAALNTGNNSLYLLLAMMIGAFVAAAALAAHTTSHLGAYVTCPRDLVAGGPAALVLRVVNSSAWLPAQAIAAGLVGLPGRVFVPLVPRRGEVSSVLVTVFPRRGRHPLPALELEVRLPLPFLVRRVRIAQSTGVLVLPGRVPAGAIRIAGVAMRIIEGGRGRGRRGSEVEHLREFRAGDDRRDIHWKQTARQQRMIVMERRERPVPSGFLVLDRQLPNPGDPVWEARFEDLVREVAAAVRTRIRQGGRVGLVIGGTVTGPGAGPDHARMLLELLAVVRPVGPGEDPLPPSLQSGAVYRLVGRS